MLDEAIKILQAAKSVFVLTGAGISAESGIPTFRGRDGLWKNYRAEELATPEAFVRDPKLVWEWYHWRQSIILKVEPNPGHYALAELEKKLPEFLLLTQNVDDLHRKAGSKNLLELHGNIFRARCTTCGKKINHQLEPEIPECECGGLLRPDIVWFGEMIPQDAWQKSIEFVTNADVAFIIGTSAVVYPAAAIPQIAKETRVKVIEINLEPTPISDFVDVSITGKSGQILTEIINGLKS